MDSQSRFPAAEWWQEDLDLSKDLKREPSGRKRHIEPPTREEREKLLASLALPMQSFEPRMKTLMLRLRRYADATGDTYHIVHSSCNIGMRLLENNPAEIVARGEAAARLARQAIEYESSNLHAWGLWCDSLVAQGAFADAENLSWESIRLFPEDPQRRSKLARLLAENLGRAQEAEQLLRDAILLFPNDRTLGAQLGGTLSDYLDRPDEAIGILRKSVAEHPNNFHTYTQLARLLSERGHQKEAIAIMEELQHREPGSRFADELLPRLR
ncbi:MAG: tetratricopeptide repeat protein, partial [Candidatus Binatia bacterium]